MRTLLNFLGGILVVAVVGSTGVLLVTGDWRSTVNQCQSANPDRSKESVKRDHHHAEYKAGYQLLVQLPASRCGRRMAGTATSYNALVSLKSSSDLQLQLSEGGVEGAFTMVSAAAWQRFFSFF